VRQPQAATPLTAAAEHIQPPTIESLESLSAAMYRERLRQSTLMQRQSEGMYGDPAGGAPYGYAAVVAGMAATQSPRVRVPSPSPAVPSLHRSFVPLF